MIGRGIIGQGRRRLIAGTRCAAEAARRVALAVSVFALALASSGIAVAATASLNITVVGPGVVKSADGAVSCLSFCIVPEPVGTTVTLVATASSGYVFVGWSGDCSGSGSCALTMNASRSVRAQFDSAPPNVAITVTPSSLAFGNQTLHTTSAAKTVSIASTGTANATLSGVTTTAGFLVSHNCPGSLAPGTSCSANVVFSPAIAGAVTGSVFVQGNWGTQTVALSGTGISPPAPPVPSPSSLDFGGQSMRTTSPAHSVVFTNVGPVALTVTSATASAGFAVTHNCASLAPGATCKADVTFTPTASGTITGSLTLATSQGGVSVSLQGVGERSLVTYYYQSILHRTPAASEKSFWEGEANRVSGLGASVNEVWYAMAQTFFSSAEYASFGRDDRGYVTDLYNTFFVRAPDDAGLAFWMSQLAAGLPREILLAQFMFSTEFASFTQSIFGTGTARPEVIVVMDFYRGILGRLPDNAGFTYWVQQFRAAECAGAAAVAAQADAISSGFLNSGEYAGRARSNPQIVGDLYNAFLRRGGDLAGASFWIGQLSSGRQSLGQARQAFLFSPEFGARIAAMAAQGCVHATPTIASVSNTTPLPLTPIALATTGIDPTLPVTVTYSNAVGYHVSGNPLRVEADGTVVVPVPLYVDQQSQQIGAGTVGLTLTQAGVSSQSISLTIQDLPSVSAYGIAPGQISRALLVFHALTTASNLNQLQMYEAVSGGTGATLPQQARTVQLLQTAIKARNDVDRLMLDPTTVIPTGSLPDGTPAQFDRNSLDMMDRVAAVFLLQAFSSPQANAELVAQGEKGIRGEKDAKSVGEDLQNILTLLTTAASADKGQRALWAAQKNCPSGATCTSDVAAALGGGLGYAKGLLVLEGAPKVLSLSVGAAGAAFNVISLVSQIYESRTMSDSQTVQPPNELKVFNTILGTCAAAAGIAAFIGGGPVLAGLATSLAIGSQVVSLASFVYDRYSQSVQQADDDATFTLASQQLVKAAMVGTITGKTGITNNQGLASAPTGVQLCGLGSQSLCLVAGADPGGNYQMSVPLGVPGTNYADLQLNAYDPVTGLRLGSEVVDLRGLSSTTPIVPPTISGSCVDDDATNPDSDDPDCD